MNFTNTLVRAAELKGKKKKTYRQEIEEPQLATDFPSNKKMFDSRKNMISQDSDTIRLEKRNKKTCMLEVTAAASIEKGGGVCENDMLLTLLRNGMPPLFKGLT